MHGLLLIWRHLTSLFCWSSMVHYPRDYLLACMHEASSPLLAAGSTKNIEVRVATLSYLLSVSLSVRTCVCGLSPLFFLLRYLHGSKQCIHNSWASFKYVAREEKGKKEVMAIPSFFFALSFDKALKSQPSWMVNLLTEYFKILVSRNTSFD